MALEVQIFPNRHYQPFQFLVTKLIGYLLRNSWQFITSPRRYLVHKLGRFEALRNLVYCFVQSPADHNRISQATSSVFGEIDIIQIASTLQQDGYALGLTLPQDVLQEILDYAHSTLCFADEDPRIAFFYPDKAEAENLMGRKFRKGGYASELCSALLNLENDPGLLAIAAQYFGKQPLCLGSYLSWSFASDKTEVQQINMSQVLHYDLEHYRSIQFLFYLTDVEASSGPHVCISGSHKNKRFLYQLLGPRCANLPDELITDTYGADRLVTVCGKAGFGFVEDTCCFHKDSLPQSKDRLLLQIKYTINSQRDIRAD